MADAAVSPLARAIRFGREVRRLRERAGFSQDEFAKRAGISRPVASRIESPDPSRRADPSHMRAALVAVAGEGTDQYRRLEPLISDAIQHGWWERWRGMGGPQQLVAAVECGATLIREYQSALIPGLAQTADYARYRAQVATQSSPDVDAVVDGRLHRQRQMTDTETRYELVLEEIALRRLTAPQDVMVDQLDHLIALAERPNISLRVLPVDARLPAGWAPTSPCSIYDYPDPADPTIVLIDVVGRPPSPMTEPAEVRLYMQLHERLVKAALSDTASVTCIKDAVARLGGR